MQNTHLDTPNAQTHDKKNKHAPCAQESFGPLATLIGVPTAGDGPPASAGWWVEPLGDPYPLSLWASYRATAGARLA
jgi:hypothetical protein